MLKNRTARAGAIGFAMMLALSILTVAADVIAAEGAGLQVGDLVDGDGRLDVSTGYTGALDATGWQMVTDSSGAPRFFPVETTTGSNPRATGGGAGWIDGFTAAGANAPVRAFAVFGGALFVGGDFTVIGGVEALHIARWNGSQWNPVGGGLDGTVYSMTVYGGGLAVGGSFNVAFDGSDPIGVNNVAIWDGAAWHGLGGTGRCEDPNASILCQENRDCPDRQETIGGQPVTVYGDCDMHGLNGLVRAVAASGADLYVGGSFETDDEAPVEYFDPEAGTFVVDEPSGAALENVARWNGSSWSAMGNGTSGLVRALVASPYGICAGGDFAEPYSRIACWNGAFWNSLGFGMLGSCSNGLRRGEVCVSNPDCDTFPGAGDGSCDTRISVEAIASVGPDLYAGGRFPFAGATEVNNIARWNGLQWSPLEADDGTVGLTGAVQGLAAIGDDLFVGGIFDRAGQVPVSNVARWNQADEAWSSLGDGLDSVVEALGVFQDLLFVGGDFDLADGLVARRVAVWNQSVRVWNSFRGGTGNGLSSPVRALALDGDVLYVGGSFKVAGGLFAGGDFDGAGGEDVDAIAHWDPAGQTWSGLDTGIEPACNGGPNAGAVCNADNDCETSPGSGDATCSPGAVLALEILDDFLYAAGRFQRAGGLAARGIASWDLAASDGWSGLGPGTSPGFDGAVNALEALDGKVYAGGDFTFVSGVSEPVNGIAAWDPDGATWNPLASADVGGGGLFGNEAGVDGVVFALTSHDGRLFAGGNFIFVESGGFPLFAPGTVSWDPDLEDWAALQSGTNDTVLALAATGGGGIYAGGRFSRTGAYIAVHLGLYATGTCGNGLVGGGEDCDPGVAGSGACCNVTTCALAEADAVCRAASGPCDLPEVCSGASTTCPADEIAAAGTECRAVAGDCDVAETCDGVGPGCHVQVVLDAGTLCRASASDCDAAEFCDGTEPVCPFDHAAAADTECRASAGDCDPAEVCNGSSFECPSDAKSRKLCRGPAFECDAAEFCDGAGDDCPADARRPAGTACTDDGNICTDDICDGADTCAHPDNSAPCEDGDLCTGPDVCAAGVCTSGDVLSCEDNDLCTVDSCDSATGCVNEGIMFPPGSCLEGGLGKLRILNRFDSGGDRLAWKWARGAAFDQADLGLPDFDTTYSMCIFDQSAGIDRFAGSINILPSENWEARGSKGYRYVDRYSTNGGLRKMLLRTGREGRTSFQLDARGEFLRTPAPTSVHDYFELDETLRVQLINSEGMCWTSEFSAEGTSFNDPIRFKAIVR